MTDIREAKFQTANQRDLEEYRLAASLLEILLIYGHPRMYAGQNTSCDIVAMDIDSHRWVMQRIWFTTLTRIAGLLHMQSPAQLFFTGYKCDRCDRIFLIPDIKDASELADMMRHTCHE